MDERASKVPPRQPHAEGEEADHAELCIRVMERFFGAVEVPEMVDSDAYSDLWALYADVVQEELAPYAFRLAYETYSKDPALVRERAERAKRDADNAGD